jgi:hypothetical protein
MRERPTADDTLLTWVEFAEQLEAENQRLRIAILKAYKKLRKQGDHDISTDLYAALEDTRGLET